MEPLFSLKNFRREIMIDQSAESGVGEGCVMGPLFFLKNFRVDIMIDQNAGSGQGMCFYFSLSSPPFHYFK